MKNMAFLDPERMFRGTANGTRRPDVSPDVSGDEAFRLVINRVFPGGKMKHDGECAESTSAAEIDDVCCDSTAENLLDDEHLRQLREELSRCMISFFSDGDNSIPMDFEKIAGMIRRRMGGLSADDIRIIGETVRNAGRVAEIPRMNAERERGSAEQLVEQHFPGRFGVLTSRSDHTEDGIPRHSLSEVSRTPDITASSTMKIESLSVMTEMEPVLDLGTETDDDIRMKVQSVIKNRLQTTASRDGTFSVRMALRPEQLGRVVFTVRYSAANDVIKVNVDGNEKALKAIERHEKAITSGVRSVGPEFSGLEYGHLDEREKRERQREKRRRKRRNDRWHAGNDRFMVRNR